MPNCTVCNKSLRGINKDLGLCNDHKKKKININELKKIIVDEPKKIIEDNKINKIKVILLECSLSDDITLSDSSTSSSSSY